MKQDTRRPAAVSSAASLRRIAPIALALFASCSTIGVDSVSKATAAIADRASNADSQEAGVLIILASSKTNSTAKIAEAIARELGATVLSPAQASPEELQKHGLIGFGSGIFDQMHHTSLLDVACALPRLPGRKVFIFSTSGVSRRFAVDHGIDDPHAPLRDSLLAKGCELIGEFNCVGFNDNSFLRLFGGMNRGRPNSEDIELAAEFARGLKTPSIARR